MNTAAAVPEAKVRFVIRMDLNQCDWTVLEPWFAPNVSVGDEVIIRDHDDREPYRGIAKVSQMYQAPYGPGTVVHFERIRHYRDDE